MESKGRERVMSARIRTALLIVGLFMLKVCTDIPALTNVVVLRYWVWDILDTFSLYYLLALCALVVFSDRRFLMGSAVFAFAALLEIAQFLQLKLPGVPMGKYDGWDFLAYAAGIIIAVSLDNLLNKRVF
jgi:hypothetical protein